MKVPGPVILLIELVYIYLMKFVISEGIFR